MKYMRTTLQDGRQPQSELFGARMKTVRESRGIHIRQLAQGLGVSRVAALQWENRRCEPSLAMIEKIAEVLAISPGYLAFGVGDAPSEPVFSNPVEEIEF